ncbi:MAG: hypothetical protein L0177_01465 [Chloroflexi bacterium]|nr:hypothetical protein [Chloroflexota bacterium]
MGKVKMTFTIPEEVAKKLRTMVSESKRSAFVAEAVDEKLAAMVDEQLERELIEGYIATREEDRAINEEWEFATLESWP